MYHGVRYEDFETATGYGTGPGLCGWNCRYNFYPFFPGISAPNYTAERLAELDARKIAYGGQLHTLYEIRQMRRALERKVRKYERRYLAEKAVSLDTTKTTVQLRAARQNWRVFSTRQEKGQTAHARSFLGLDAIEENARGVMWEGRKMTGYEATQYQNRIERNIRTQKRRVLMDEAAGAEDQLLVDQIKLTRLNQEYARYNRAMGFKSRADRLEVVGWGRGKAAKATAAYREELEKYSKIHYNEDGTIIVTDDWKEKGKVSIPRKYKQNAVVETKTVHKDGTEQVDRTIYDENGMMTLQIHSGPHNRPDKHPYGEKGEHVHRYVWNDKGELIDRKVGELSDVEREQHRDILGEMKEGEESDAE